MKKAQFTLLSSIVISTSSHAVTTASFEGFVSTSTTLNSPTAISGTFSYNEEALTGDPIGETLTVGDILTFEFSAFGQTFTHFDDSDFTGAMGDFFALTFQNGEPDSIFFIATESESAFNDLDTAFAAETMSPGFGFPFGGNTTAITDNSVEAFVMTSDSITAVPVPEPSALLFLGTFAFAVNLRRKR